MSGVISKARLVKLGRPENTPPGSVVIALVFRDRYVKLLSPVNTLESSVVNWLYSKTRLVKFSSPMKVTFFKRGDLFAAQLHSPCDRVQVLLRDIRAVTNIRDRSQNCTADLQGAIAHGGGRCCLDGYRDGLRCGQCAITRRHCHRRAAHTRRCDCHHGTGHTDSRDPCVI